MDNFKLYSQSDVISFVNKRDGEVKLGEKVLTVSSLNEISNSTAKFVLLGIPEDIGVRANFGIGGAKTVWQSTLKSFLNTQSNSNLQGGEILVLGHFEINEPQDQNINSLRKKVNEIDELVYPIIEKILSAGKIPIVIGGGHNNAFPIIKGTSIALQQKINVINIDAHADLRNIAEGRHSGNGFSQAFADNFLNQYRIFGLHQNYTHKDLPDLMTKQKQDVKAFYFEDLLLSKQSISENYMAFTKDLINPMGLEIDLDSIENVLSSATTTTGFTVNDIRKILLGNDNVFSYLHICEGATKLTDGREDLTTGKTIAYLISDFIKALLPRISPQP